MWQCAEEEDEKKMENGKNLGPVCVGVRKRKRKKIKNKNGRKKLGRWAVEGEKSGLVWFFGGRR